MESFDHIVRGPEQRERIERYIHDKPCGLPADQFSLGSMLYQALSDERSSDGEQGTVGRGNAAERRVYVGLGGGTPRLRKARRRDAAST